MSRWSRMTELARGIRATQAARERERWTGEQLRAHQARAVDALVRDVAQRSPFHRDRYAELIGHAPVELTQLPTLDKATLMANLDDALCEPRLRGRDLRSHLHDSEALPGGFRVMASSGSTGTPSLYVYSRADWTGVLALFLRYNALVGIRPRAPRLRIAAIGAPSLASMTQKIAQSADVGLHRLLRLAVTEPLPHLVEALNAYRPDALTAYPSIAALLADEQLAGRLRIAPSVISTSSELRTPEMTERIERAFGVRPFDLYGTTEGLWGVDCEHHDGIHLFTDWCIVENVDANGLPVPDGDPGERLLVTNLFNRTLPMIRFEISDLMTLDRRPCRCGRTLPRVRAVHGRLDDVVRLPGAPGMTVPVHPTQFSLVAGDPAVREFQVEQHGARIVLRLALQRRRRRRCTGADRAHPGRPPRRARRRSPRRHRGGDGVDRAVPRRQAAARCPGPRGARPGDAPLIQDREIDPAQPLGVGEEVDRDDLPVADREGADRERHTVAGRDRAGHTVDERRPHEQAEPRVHARLAGDRLRAAQLAGRRDRGRRGARRPGPAPRPAPRSRRRARPRGTRRRPRAGGRVGVGHRLLPLDATARPAGELARRLGRAVDDRRDLVERHREHVVQHEREPLGRLERLEHDEQREADRVGQHRLVLRVGPSAAVDDRVRHARRAAPRGAPCASAAC